METKQLGTTEQDLALAGELLRQGQLVAFPTETVYGPVSYTHLTLPTKA